VEKQLALQNYIKGNTWHTISGGRKTMMLKGCLASTYTERKPDDWAQQELVSRFLEKDHGMEGKPEAKPHARIWKSSIMD
jgi:hypothetical protein